MRTRRNDVCSSGNPGEAGLINDAEPSHGSRLNNHHKFLCQHPRLVEQLFHRFRRKFAQRIGHNHQIVCRESQS